ncbi:GAF and ANTAR domain-containing protein [Saccharothrix sp. S26]|uniref:GAF and ANTAR domain-containing protein n=1 Tax=Saccharothrix sp. S26 TaxID=2907215 RepID=UPI001F230F4C|nr:GAF and ANTAR domain-containing protein [Saccharothrix sp. S26]MCE6995453.1 GAF and ANTAR domain-containing protein [Saccharothrix sp. S26]
MASDASSTDELAGVFARVSGLLLSTETVDTALKLITSLARQTVPGTVGSGITLLDQRGERVTAAATDAVVGKADALQYRLGRGPCLKAWEDRVVVRVDDLADDDRWPDWSRPTAELGLRSALSAPLVAGSRALGALKVYAHRPHAYGAREEQVLTLFATQAAVLLANVRTAQDAERISDRLKDRLREREVVTLAKGIIMARDGVDERTAFLALADTAGRQGTTLRQAAERLTRSTVRRRR